jgi:hypothetical protein
LLDQSNSRLTVNALGLRGLTMNDSARISTMGARDQPSSFLGDGMALSLLTLFASGLALSFTIGRCSSDGSYDVFGSDASRSSYCKLSHLPALPNRPMSVLVIAVVFLGPTITAIVGTVIASRTGRIVHFKRAAVASGGLAVLSFALIPLAHVRFTGAV